MSSGNAAGAVLYQSGFEPLPIPDVSIYGAAMWGNGGIPPRVDFRRRRPVAEGLSYVDPTAAISAVETQMDWRGQHPDYLNRRRRPATYVGPQPDFFVALPVVETITSDKWTGNWPDYLNRRKRATYVGAQPDFFVALPETITSDKWTGNWPDYLNRREHATYEGLEEIEVFGWQAEIASQYRWRGAFPDWIASRERPVDVGLAANVLDEVFVVPTLDRWKPTYLDRYYPRKQPVREGLFAFWPEPITTPPVTPTVSRSMTVDSNPSDSLSLDSNPSDTLTLDSNPSDAIGIDS